MFLFVGVNLFDVTCKRFFYSKRLPTDGASVVPLVFVNNLNVSLQIRFLVVDTVAQIAWKGHFVLRVLALPVSPEILFLISF